MTVHKKRDLASLAKSPKQLDKLWCRGPESNWGHEDFQSTALPTELPRHNLDCIWGRGLCSGYGTRLVLCKYLILLYLTLAPSTASLIRPTRDFVKEKRVIPERSTDLLFF